MKKDGKYQIIERGDKEYPKNLERIKKPPERLYCLGDISLLKNRMAAVVGSRKTSVYGRWVAKEVARRLSENGITVISGMARGIDTNAHISAISEEGSTIAVLGCGIDKCYPAENLRLKEEIVKKGLVISEYPMGTEAKKWTFPQRNRIIAGLAEIVVIAEAGLNSGAFITAELAMDQSKPVLAVPGNINNAYNIGNNKLLLDGATPVVVIDDVIEAMGIETNGILRRHINLSAEEKRLIEALIEWGEMSIDDICRAMGKSPGETNGIVTILEMKGAVQTSMGKVFIAKY